MRIKLTAIMSLTALLLIAGYAAGDKGGGGQGGAFLKIPVGARPSGMGNAFVSVSDDANALYFNPGGLYQTKGAIFDGTYSLMSMDRTHYQGSFIYSDERFGALGLMFTGFGVSDIDGRDGQGNPTQKFNDSELTFSLAYGRQLFRFLGVGASLKYLDHSLKDNKATGFGFDLGVHCRIEVENPHLNSVRLGMSATDLGAKLKWNTGSSHEDEIPFTIRFGTGFDLKFDGVETLLTLEGSHTSGESSRFHCGVEAWFYRILALRAGLDDKDLNFGASIRYQQIQFDYAFCPDILGEGATSNIGIQVEF